MLECRGVVKPLPPAADGGVWEVQLSAGSQIPFITDGVKRHWCMTLFQQTQEESAASNPAESIPDLNLDNIVPADPKAVPVASLPGVTPRPLDWIHSTNISQDSICQY